MPQISSLAQLGQLSIVGPGRVGCALTSALRDAGVTVTGPLGHSDALPTRGCVLLTVRDDQIANIAAKLPPDCVIGHCAGALELDVLGSGNAFSWHPLRAIQGDETSFKNVVVAEDWNSEIGRSWAQALSSVLGVNSLRVQAVDRPLYHTAACLLLNMSVIVMSAAEELANEIGIDRSTFVASAPAAVASWVEHGDAAITGPIMRGDDNVVAAQRAALVERAPVIVELFDAIANYGSKKRGNN